MFENVIGLGVSNCTHWPPTPTNGVFQAVAGLPSAALAARHCRQPGSDSLASAVTRSGQAERDASMAASVRAGVHARVAGEREAARRGQRRTRARSTAPDRCGAGPDASASRVITSTSGCVRGARAQRVEQVLRHLHDLVDAHVVVGVLVAEPDLREADRVGAAEQLAAGVADAGDLDLERARTAASGTRSSARRPCATSRRARPSPSACRRT